MQVVFDSWHTALSESCPPVGHTITIPATKSATNNKRKLLRKNGTIERHLKGMQESLTPTTAPYLDLQAGVDRVIHEFNSDKRKGVSKTRHHNESPQA